MRPLQMRKNGEREFTVIFNLKLNRQVYFTCMIILRQSLDVLWTVIFCTNLAMRPLSLTLPPPFSSPCPLFTRASLQSSREYLEYAIHRNMVLILILIVILISFLDEMR